MNRVCVVVDGLKGLSGTQKSKIRRFVKGLDEIVFVINSYNPYFERFYFYESDEFKPARDTHYQKLRSIQEDIYLEFEPLGISIKVIEHWEKDLTRFVESLLEEKEYSLLILSTADITNRYTIHLETIRAINCPVMMLSHKGWPKHLVFSAAIDPVHQKDVNNSMDSNILKSARLIAKHLNANLRLVHSTFTPPLLQEYSKQIISIHNQTINRFIENHKLSELNFDRITGNPEISLPTYVSNEGIDLLVIGSMARNSTDLHFVGSTAENLLRFLPCDLLFIK